MNLSSCGVSNDQHIFLVFWKWWRPFLYILFKRGTPGLHSLFCWFQVIWGQIPVLEMEKKTSWYIHVFRQKNPSHHRGSTVNAKGKSVRVYWKIYCREDIQWTMRVYTYLWNDVNVDCVISYIPACHARILFSQNVICKSEIGLGL